MQHYVIKFIGVSDLQQVWFSPVSSTHKTDPYNITEILLKVALNTINQPTNLVEQECLLEKSSLYLLTP
jgi:hypothetical protein